MAEQAGNETPAPSAEVTPEVAPEKTTPQEAITEVAEENKDTPATKTFTQDELNDIVKRAKAATEAKTERRVLRMLEGIRQPQQPVHQEPQAPTRYEGESEDAYIDRLVDEKLSRRTQAEKFNTVVSKTENMYAQAEKLPGFDREVFDSLPLTSAMAQTLADADGDISPKLMAFLCENSGEVERIAKLPSARQAAELGKLETRLTQSKPPVQKPKAPEPINPVGSGKAPVTDPSRMSNEEYYSYRMKQKPVWAR